MTPLLLAAKNFVRFEINASNSGYICLYQALYRLARFSSVFCVQLVQSVSLFACTTVRGMDMSPYVYAVYWLRTASSAFLLARKCN